MRALSYMAGALTALALAGCAPEGPRQAFRGAPDAGFTVSAITVQADLSVVRSREAAAFWQGLRPDLETALAEEFIGAIAPDGRILRVEVSELTLTPPDTGRLGDARMAGRVEVLDADARRVLATYDLAAAASEPEGGSERWSTTELYIAVVRAFARGTVEALGGQPAELPPPLAGAATSVGGSAAGAPAGPAAGVPAAGGGLAIPRLTLPGA